jgi:hexosaminidase
VFFWGEYPLKPDDISSLPSHLVNSEVYGPDFDPVFKSHGIRQMIFTSTVGWKEFFFSNYYMLPAADHLPGPPGGPYEPVRQGPGYVGQMLNTIENTPARKNADLMGTFVAGWADTGIHPEVMWLGYATGSAAGWHPKAASEQELMNSFYLLFYGPSATRVGRVYQLMSEQGQFWKESWGTAASSARSPIWGDWDRINNPPQPAEDQTLPLPPVPSKEVLTLEYDWRTTNERRVQMAGRFLSENDELLDLLHENLRRVEFNRYNLELYIAIAQLYRQNIDMLMDLEQINTALQTSQAAASKADANKALASLDQALGIAEHIRQERNQAFSDAVAVWYKSWYPRVAEANGRRFVDRVDDVKDHLPVRTVDMTYLIYRQLLYPLGEWATRVLAVRNQYAEAHHLPTRTDLWDWKATSN